MAENRFKKSIENAIDNTKENAPRNTNDNIKKNIKNSESAIIDENVLYNTVENIQTNTMSKTSGDILKKILENEKKDKGGNHTIYLSAEVGSALNVFAKKTGKSKSILVDEILREILIGDK